MITPRRTRLIRVPDLRTFREEIRQLAQDFSPAIIVVPSRSAARQLAIDNAATRDELYERLHARLSPAPRLLTAVERDVMAQAAARSAAVDRELAFRLRPGLVAEMLRFYDLLRRQSQQVKRFEELIHEALGSDDIDRGARRMREQTAFLAATFREYERLVGESGAVDEHALRERLIADAASAPIRRVIVTVADWIADADGLFVADFDLLSRVPGLEMLDIVATERVLGSGFHERLHNWLPGIEESNGSRSRSLLAGLPAAVLVTPPGAPAEEPWWTHRDREEELVAVARHIKGDERAAEADPLDRTAVVFKQPLPYLYLAGEVFGSARIPFSTFDALPLAAEPVAASLDLILEAAHSNFTRDTLVSLLRSPHMMFDTVSRPAVAALDRELSDRRYLGDLVRLESAVESIAGPAVPAADAAMKVARALAPLRETAAASQQLSRLADCWEAWLRPLDLDAGLKACATAGLKPDAGLKACATDERKATSDQTGRERRARQAIVDTIRGLSTVHAAHDDPEWTIDEVAMAVRRAIEEQTFDIPSAAGGVRLLDDRAARYGDFDAVTIVGLSESDWPERPRRNIFYPPALLKSLGWPSEKDRRAAADAHFLDLLGCASRRTALSTFTLEDDAIVTRSIQLDEIPRARMSSVARADAPSDARAFLDEDLSLEPTVLDRLDASAREWAEMRVARSAADEARFHGQAGPPPARVWSVSAIETYLGCPFRFFAQHVLKLEEEPDDEEVMNPRKQGEFVHDVFERFFAEWQASGGRSITLETLDAARALFAEVVAESLKGLPDAEAGLERTRLLGSPAAAGLGEAVMRMEAERPTEVVRRLLEHPLKGDFTFVTADGPRVLPMRGKADRIDLLADGTFRLIDYKLGWPPDRRKALQLPIYSICAEQDLLRETGRKWVPGEATYLAFKGPRRVVPLFTTPSDREKVLAEAQERLVKTVDAIDAGQFPPTPDDVYRCETCSYAAVCRKDYVGDV